MKAFKVIAILVLMLLLQTGVVGTAHAANWKNLNIYNKTGYTIKAFYLVPYKSSSWGDEQITARGYSTFNNGTYLPLSYNADYSKWWMKIVFNNGATREWSGENTVNLSGATKLSILSSGKDGKGIENFRWQKN